MIKPLFPSIRLNITGPDGNAYVIMAVISNCLKKVGYSKEEINKVIDDMKSSNYEHLCEVAKKYIYLDE